MSYLFKKQTPKRNKLKTIKINNLQADVIANGNCNVYEQSKSFLIVKFAPILRGEQE